MLIGTAAVAVGGILSSLRVSGMNLKDHKFLFFGAGGVSACDFIVLNILENIALVCSQNYFPVTLFIYFYY